MMPVAHLSVGSVGSGGGSRECMYNSYVCLCRRADDCGASDRKFTVGDWTYERMEQERIETGTPEDDAVQAWKQGVGFEPTRG
jgi:hypothetical protein